MADILQKDICANEIAWVYSKRKGGKFLFEIKMGSIVAYKGNGKVTFRGKTGYLDERWIGCFCPVVSNGWKVAVCKKNMKLPLKPGGSGGANMLKNDVIRVLPSSEKNGWVRCAILNDAWEWDLYIKKGDFVTVDHWPYDSIAHV